MRPQKTYTKFADLEIEILTSSHSGDLCRIYIKKRSQNDAIEQNLQGFEIEK